MQKLRLARFLVVVSLVAVISSQVFSQSSTHSSVKNLKITILSTMLADEGLGEWGFAALVEAAL